MYTYSKHLNPIIRPNHSAHIKPQTLSSCLSCHHQYPELYRQLRISPPTSQRLQRLSNIRSNDWDIPSKLANRNQEIPEQYEKTVQLDDESRQRPTEEDQEDACEKGDGAFDLLAAREEGDGFVQADYET